MKSRTTLGGMTGLAGLPAYLELAHVMGLGQTISRDLQAHHGDQGWTDEQTVKSLVLQNLTGGDCVEDLLVPEEGKVSRWYRERCGKGEEAHSIMKEDLPGGKLSSGLFGAQATWLQIMILTFSLNGAMKRLVSGEGTYVLFSCEFTPIFRSHICHEPVHLILRDHTLLPLGKYTVNSAED